MRKILLLLPLAALAGCATGPSLESRMSSYTGASEQTLVQNFGVPDKQVTVAGVQYLAYDRRELDVSPGFIGPYGYGGPFYPGFDGPGPWINGGFPARVNEISCETTFMLRNDKVVGFTLRGDDCT